MGLKNAVIAVVFVACTPAAQQSAQPSTQNVEVKDASAAPLVVTPASSSSASTSASPPPEPRRNGPTLKANAAMKMEGTLDDKQIVQAANANAVGLQQCAVPLVSNDPNVGSLNLQIKVDANGAVSGDLQSPAHDDAKKCILDLVKTWKVTGSGKAMVLLSVVH